MAVTAISSHLFAQQVDSIRPNMDAVELRRVWSVGGRSGDEIGMTLFSFGDLFRTGRSAWFVGGTRDAAEKGLYLWDTITEQPRLRQQQLPILFLGCSGRFFGTGERFAVVATGHGDSTGNPVPWLLLYRPEGDTLNLTPHSEWDGGVQTPREFANPSTLTAADMDQDGVDDLVVFFPSFKPWFMIYRGGAGFSLETPTVKVLDTLSKSTNSVPHKLFVGRIDDDQLPDVATIVEYRINGHDSTMMSLWLSSQQPVWEWNQPHRRISFSDAYRRFSFDLNAFDLNGDSVLDFGLLAALDGKNATPLYLSGQGKDVMTRSFTAADADLTLTSSTYLELKSWGYISDSSHKYSVLSLGQLDHYGFSGGPNGPDARWDVTAGGVIGDWIPIGDATGDGWEDLLAGYAYSGANQGNAALYAGGPYIPHDPTVGVEWTAVTGDYPKAIATWPNPATDLVHIAWRGDLRTMPRSFRIHDAAGTLIAEGSVPAGTGEARWNCAERPSGAYTLTVLDADNRVLATTRLLIQR